MGMMHSKHSLAFARQLCVALSAALGWLAFGHAGVAEACNSGNGTNHCYAVVQKAVPNYGASQNMVTHCLRADNSGPGSTQFAVNDTWVLNGQATKWIEAGAIAGFDTYPNDGNNMHYFTANRNGSGSIDFYAFPGGPSYGQSFGVSIHGSSGSNWSLNIGGNQVSSTGVLPLPADLLQTGIEATPGAHGRGEQNNLAFWNANNNQQSGWGSTSNIFVGPAASITWANPYTALRTSYDC